MLIRKWSDSMEDADTPLIRSSSSRLDNSRWQEGCKKRVEKNYDFLHVAPHTAFPTTLVLSKYNPVSAKYCVVNKYQYVLINYQLSITQYCNLKSFKAKFWVYYLIAWDNYQSWIYMNAHPIYPSWQHTKCLTLTQRLPDKSNLPQWRSLASLDTFYCVDLPRST